MRQILAICISILLALSGAHACEHDFATAQAEAGQDDARLAVGAGHGCHETEANEPDRPAKPDLTSACSPFCTGGAGCGAPGVLIAAPLSSIPKITPDGGPAIFAAIAGLGPVADPPPPKA